MPDLTFTGIGSGLQVSEIVSAIVGAEKAPFISRANKQQAEMTTDISAIGALKSALESVTNSISSLADADNYQLRAASGSDSFVGLSASKDAQVGNYSVKVDVLAQAHKLMSGAIDSDQTVGEGTLNIAVAESDFDIAVSATDTLSDIRDAINDSVDNDSVIATIVTDDAGQHLIMTSKETGVVNAITTTVTGDSGGDDIDNLGLSRLAYDVSDPDSLNHIKNLAEVTEALDAQITIDDTLVVTSSTNTFKDVIDGVDITAKKMHEVDDDISKISFTENNANIKSGLEKFVKSYNELQVLSKQLGAAGEGGSGPLAGDSLLRGVMGKLRQQFSQEFDMGNGKTSSLSQLGVQSDQYGVLSLDTETLNEYIDSDVGGVQQFFVGSDSANGFANSLERLTSFYTDSDGVIQNRIDSRTSQLDKLDDSYLTFERRMESLEARLYSQYNAMDLIVAQLNSTSTYLMAQLDNMPGVVRKNN
ncbi:flagellar filament capping protein FliD [Colwellia hornerae]|uniref:Flagellar hook-associated protein 2 n=1 Tax=Colwellia hornerae TaxID=89402 RepID=A0A5C6QKR1_9GAMM|nr:flagellar filament capping protein FliD [Colwellia hornerae]TWX54133.1 flagellar hook protein FliD [Colwellia hornerae]TWX60908.1 flagellar hook protein FliD [Colwellia hornerae]TWX69238.1 flagellar hook protein FliD [Colwellia hornerae]